MSNTLFTRDFNSDTLDSIPGDLVAKMATPDGATWQVKASGPNSIYTKALQVYDDTGDLCVALFSAVDPAAANDSEVVVLFQAQAYEAFFGLQCNAGGNYWVAGMVTDGSKAIAEWEYDFEVVLEDASFAFNYPAVSWYIMRFRMYNGVGSKLKIWEYGDEEPEAWQVTGGQYHANSQPGFHIGLKGGQIDIAYFSVGYGVGNLPQLPDNPPAEPISRSCISGFTFAASGIGEEPPTTLSRKCSTGIKLRACTRIWRPSSLAHLSFNALSKIFSFNATAKRFIYTAKPGRDQ